MQDFGEFWKKYGHSVKGVKSAKRLVEYLFQKQKDQQQDAIILDKFTKPYETLFDNHVLYWFNQVKYFSEGGLLSKTSSDEKVACYISEYCIFFAKARNDRVELEDC